MVAFSDSVCGMSVPADGQYRRERAGATYRFCSPRCLAKFSADPERYLAPEPAVAARPAAGYTCPMHSAIRQSGPGSCPICRMALEPLEVSLEAAENPELAEMTRRFFVSALLTVPLAAIAMSEMLPGTPLQDAVSAQRLGFA